MEAGRIIVLKDALLLRRNQMMAPEYNKRGTINALRGYCMHIWRDVKPEDTWVLVRIYNRREAYVPEGRWKDDDTLLIPRRYFTSAFFEAPPFLGPLIMR